LETYGLGGLLALGLLAVGERVPANVLGQSFLLLSTVGALWCALRMRLPTGRWPARLLREGALALGLSLALGGGVPALTAAVGWAERLAWANLGALGVALVLAGSGAIFAVLRAGVWLWHYWNRLRRRRLLWSLTHAHLVVVVAVALLVAVLGGIQVAASVTDPPRRLTPDWAPALVDLLARTVFPFLGIVVVWLAGLLIILLPPSALFSYFVARRTTRRLESLTAAAAALRRGDLSARVDVTGEDEVAQLQADFNAMAADLEAATGELQAERDKIVALLEARRALMANVSHELRTPVATLRGYLEAASAGADGVPAGLRRDLEVMAGEVERLQKLIDDLFTLARAEVEGLSLRLEPTDVAPLVRNRVAALAPLAWQTGRVEVVAEVPPEPQVAHVDPDRLEQVLVNLLRNGVRHTPPGGIVAVVVIGEADHVRVDVRDTGAGIPAEELDRVWERFYRGAEAQVRDGRGAGLGLALVKELTEAMGGTVALESAAGEGSRFTLRLPRALPRP
jgi:signal transduction histidine kinase